MSTTIEGNQSEPPNVQSLSDACTLRTQAIWLASNGKRGTKRMTVTVFPFEIEVQQGKTRERVRTAAQWDEDMAWAFLAQLANKQAEPVRTFTIHYDFEAAHGRAISRHAARPSSAELRVTSTVLNLASFIAAGSREQARAEWIGEQSASEAGESGSVDERLRFAMGLIRAAVQIRMSRFVAPALDFIDRVISSEPKTCVGIAVVMLTTSSYVFHTQGFTGVIADGESLLAEGGAIYALARWRRRALRTRDELAGENTDIRKPPEV
jgi:hypothetical protein